MLSTSGEFTQSIAFTVAGLELTIADVILFGIASGEWLSFVRGTEQALETLASAESQPPVEVVRGAANRFRRERGLLTSEELGTWVAARGFNHDDLAGSLERRVAVVEPSPGATKPATATAGLREAVEVDAWTSGVLERCARRLLDVVVGARIVADRSTGSPDPQRVDELAAQARTDPTDLASMSEEPLRLSLERILRWEDSFGLFVADIATPERVEAVLREHELGWTTFVYDLLPCPSEEIARAIRLAVRDDGVDIAELSRSLGIQSRRLERVAEELDRTTLVAVTSATPGDLLPAIPLDGRWALISVVERRRPSIEDPAFAARATAVVVEGALRATRAELADWRL